MSGTPKGRLGAFIYTKDVDRNSQESFVTTYRALELLKVAGYVNRIALYYGDGGATGMNYWDEANPCGENSFVVYQFPPYGSRTWSWYFLMQWNTGTGFGTVGNGSPGLIKGAAGATGFNWGFQAACGRTGGGADASPWGGTTLNNGADSKSTPVWSNPGSVWVYPRSNNTGGSHSVNKQNCAALVNEASTLSDEPMVVNIVADRDSISVSRFDVSGGVTAIMACGPYTPLSGLTATNPFYMISSTPSFSYTMGSTVIGTTAGTGTVEGGILAPLDGTVRTFKMSVPYWSTTVVDYTVNGNYSPPRLSLISPEIFVSESGAYGKVGLQTFLYQSRQSITSNTPGGFIPMAMGNVYQDKLFVSSGLSPALPATDFLNPSNNRDGVDF